MRFFVRFGRFIGLLIGVWGKRKSLENVVFSRLFAFGGDKRDRTADLLNAIQFASASSREFVLVLPVDRKAGVDEATLRQLEKTICDHGLRVKLAEEQDVKRLLAIYYQQDLTTEVFHDFDGEEYVHG